MLLPRSSLRVSLVILCCALLAACSTPRDASAPAPTPSPQNQPKHIVDLIDQRLLTVRITGIGMDSLALHMQSMSPEPLQVEIPAGTYFVAQDARVQNMVARHAASELLEPFKQLDLTLDAACASLRRAEPGSTDTFGIVRASEQPELGKVIEALNKADMLYPVEQAAIWIVTDDASYDDLGMLVGGSRYGSALIGEGEAVQAMRLVSEAGLDISKYAIWREVAALRSRLADVDLAAWLDGQMAAAPASTATAATARAALQPVLPQAAVTPEPQSSAGSGEVVSQWASFATADRELDPGSAMQAEGAPDTVACGHQLTAWASGDSNPGAVLSLWYAQPVIPSRIVIYETYNPGAIFYVEIGSDESSDVRQVYQSDAALNPQCPHQLVIDIADVDTPMNIINISVDQSLAWTEIDAVQLVGTTP